jgi:hypothetical protein
MNLPDDYPTQVADFIGSVLSEVARQESDDIRGVLRAWPDLAEEHLMRLQPPPPRGVSEDGTALVFHPVIYLGDMRYVGTEYPGHLVPVDVTRTERTHQGEHFKVALVARSEMAKIPPEVATSTEVIDFGIGDDDE